MFLLASSALAAPPPDVIPHRKHEPYTQLDAELRPIGFSPDGKLAILYVAPDEAVGCMQWSFLVIGLVSDGVVDRIQTTNEPCDADIQVVWERESTRVQAMLDKHGVVATEVAFQRFSTGFDARLVTGSLHLPENEELPFKVPVTVMLSADGKGEKKIGQLAVTTQYDMPMTWGHEVLGYVQSPYEPRIGVLVREIHRGWEGLPTVETVHVIGASLEEGF
ncbi:MAG: hypothetical protein GY913_35780 [Proteobacteria bacterium]|nr:hypothetical protein [Pseudomonadota bacterium]